MYRTSHDTLRISVALATYNGAKYLPELLDSLTRQTVLPYEVVVSDDSSDDDTLSILNLYAQKLPIIIHISEKSIGVVSNFKRAVAMCRGDYIAFCDQDDVWFPDKLALSLEKLLTIDDILPAMVFTDVTVVDDSLRPIANSYWQHRKLNPAYETFASLLWGNFVTGFTMLINKPMAYEVAKMPDTVLMHDFWIACIAYGLGHCDYISQPTSFYRQHTSNVTNNDAVTLLLRYKRLVEFLRNSRDSRLYLQPQLNQARLFYELYSQILGTKNKKIVTNFLKMESRSPLYRKWSAFLIKFLHLCF